MKSDATYDEEDAWFENLSIRSEDPEPKPGPSITDNNDKSVDDGFVRRLIRSVITHASTFYGMQTESAQCQRDFIKPHLGSSTTLQVFFLYF